MISRQISTLLQVVSPNSTQTKIEIQISTNQTTQQRIAIHITIQRINQSKKENDLIYSNYKIIDVSFTFFK